MWLAVRNGWISTVSANVVAVLVLDASIPFSYVLHFDVSYHDWELWKISWIGMEFGFDLPNVKTDTTSSVNYGRYSILFGIFFDFLWIESTLRKWVVCASSSTWFLPEHNLCDPKYQAIIISWNPVKLLCLFSRPRFRNSVFSSLNAYAQYSEWFVGSRR